MKRFNVINLNIYIQCTIKLLYYILIVFYFQFTINLVVRNETVKAVSKEEMLKIKDNIS